MNNSGFAETTSLKSVMNDFLGSYAERDKNGEFSDWFNEKLQQQMPDMSKEASKKLANEIIEAVASYDKTLGELNIAIDAGQSKEEWFAGRMAEVYVDMPMDVAGKKLQQIENAYTASNTQLMRETDKMPLSEIITADADAIGWNEYSMKDKVYQIGNQAILSGLAAAANAVQDRVEGDNAVNNIGGIVGEALQDGLKAASGEVKAAVAGAVKIAAVRGLEDMLPSNTPTETICDMAGAAIEGAGALLDVAKGKSTMAEALDKTGRANVAVACRLGSAILKGEVAMVPVVGPLLVYVLGGLFEHMEDVKFYENVYTVVHDTAVATWKGIKESVGGVFNGLKNMLFN